MLVFLLADKVKLGVALYQLPVICWVEHHYCKCLRGDAPQRMTECIADLSDTWMSKYSGSVSGFLQPAASLHQHLHLPRGSVCFNEVTEVLFLNTKYCPTAFSNAHSCRTIGFSLNVFKVIGKLPVFV